MFSLPFDVEKSITIAASLETTFQTLSNFHTWKNWSPWLCQEPECPLNIQGDPHKVSHSQTWQGERIGEGTIQITDIASPNTIHFDLNIIKPWKSSSKVQFKLKEDGDKTKVTWTMQGSVPIFLFFMRSMMSNMIACDYERGLRMLKDLLEKGEVHSQSTIKDKVTCESRKFIGKRREANMTNFEEVMQADFEQLIETFQEEQYGKVDLPACLYHTFDPVKNKVVYSLGFFMHEFGDLPKGYFKQTFPEHTSLHVIHLGPYHHLSNAWSTAMGYLRFRKYKFDKKVPMYEIYSNNEKQIEHIKDLETLIYLPIK